MLQALPSSGIQGGALDSKKFSCILEAPDGLSWNLSEAKFGGGIAPLPPLSPPMAVCSTATVVTLLLNAGANVSDVAVVSTFLHPVYTADADATGLQLN